MAAYHSERDHVQSLTNLYGQSLTLRLQSFDYADCSDDDLKSVSDRTLELSGCVVSMNFDKGRKAWSAAKVTAFIASLHLFLTYIVVSVSCN